MKMKERLYLTEDRSRAVVEEDRAGRYLLCKKGAELDDKVAAKYGIVDGVLKTNSGRSFEKAFPPKEIILEPEVKRTKSKSKKKVKK